MPLELLASFLDEQRLRRNSPRTIETYERHLRPYCLLAASMPPREALLSLLERHVSEATRKSAYMHVKAFVRWCASAGHGQDWISGLRFRFAPTPRQQIVDRADLARLLAAVPDTWAGCRDRAWIVLAWETGARMDALRLLRWDDVSVDTVSGKTSIRVRTKGRTQLDIGLPFPALEALAAWQCECPMTEWVFPSLRDHSQPICYTYYPHKVRHYARAAGFARRVYPHLMRHSHATILGEAGVPAEVIQQRLGLSSITTAMIYTRVSPARADAAAETVFG